MRIKNKLIIALATILFIVFAIGSYYYFSKVRPYNQLNSDANQAMTKEDYDKAVTLYGETLSYKNDSEISKKIDLAKLLKKSKETYDISEKQMVDKNYLTAIDGFKKVDKHDTKRYFNSQNSISKCKELYIAANLKSANDNITNKKFDEASNYIGYIIKLDANNTAAKKLKVDIIADIKKQKDEELAAQALAEARTKEAAKRKVVAENKTVVKPKAVTKYPAYNPNIPMCDQRWIPDPWVQDQIDWGKKQGYIK